MRATLRKYEILSSAKRIETLFARGTALTSYSVRAIFLYAHDEAQTLSPVQTLFSVPGRNFRKATQRNLLRRRLKEAYRKNKHILYSPSRQMQGTIYIALLYSAKHTEPYSSIEKSVIKLLQEIIVKIQSAIESNSGGA